MATTKFYLDTRATKPGNASPLKLAVGHKGRTFYLSLNLNLFPEQWDALHSVVVNHPNRKMFNVFLQRRKSEIDNYLFELAVTSRLQNLTIKELKDEILRLTLPITDSTPTDNLFVPRLLRFTDMKTAATTKALYLGTLKQIKKFLGNDAECLKFEDITKEWLIKFDSFLANTSPSQNARNIHLRNIRAVFNDALDDEITTHYPFRKFKIKAIATRKRSLSVDDLRLLFNSSVEPHQRQYLDMFKLIFCLIGINLIDLCNLKAIRNGRIEYYRAKTHRLYDIKVEPEALEIMNRYKGEKYLLNILDRYNNYKDYMKKINLNLQRIGEVKRIGLGGKKVFKPLFPELTTYWARHSWATIAASLDIPKETIAAALGHGGNTVTDIYIDFDQKKVDMANRKVLDYVFYNKTE